MDSNISSNAKGHPPLPQHFLSLLSLSAQQCRSLITRAIELKADLRKGAVYQPFIGKTLGMIFEKSSTRTRVSFETAMIQMGGGAIFLSPRDTQLGRGEPIGDSARVLSSMLDAITIRTFAHATLETFAQYSKVPIINALTDSLHPCQLLADMQTFHELRGDIQGAKVAWIGDGNNMCHSYINAAEQFDFTLHIACPKGFEPDPNIVNASTAKVLITNTPKEAVQHSDLVVTDVWASMGQEDESNKRLENFKNFQISPRLLDLANKQALFMHCLPAHRGEEISEDLLEDPRSCVWQEAENRLHSQKALLECLLLTR